MSECEVVLEVQGKKGAQMAKKYVTKRGVKPRLHFTRNSCKLKYVRHIPPWCNWQHEGFWYL